MCQNFPPPYVRPITYFLAEIEIFSFFEGEIAKPGFQYGTLIQSRQEKVNSLSIIKNDIKILFTEDMVSI